MRIELNSLQKKFAVFLIIPVTLLLIGMGVAGFFYARDLLLDQAREAAILKLQRAAHEIDMRLGGIKGSIQLFHENPGRLAADALHAWALENLSLKEGVADVRIDWTPTQDRIDAAPLGAHGRHGQADMAHQAHTPRSRNSRVQLFTPPRFDVKGEQGTVSLVSDLDTAEGQTVGRLEVLVDFNFIFRHVKESGWWKSNKAFLVDARGEVIVCTEPGRHGNLADAQDPLERETFKAMALAPEGTLLGPGHPPEEVSGFFHLQEAPWVLVMIAPGREILAPVIRLRTLYAVFGTGFIVAIIALIRWVGVRTTSGIQTVSDAALKLSRGEFGEPLPVGSRDEVGRLTRSFNLMSSQLRERLQLKQAMSLAMEVQQNLLPAAAPSLPGFDIAGRSVYCQETGGDYFDYIFRDGDERRRHLCIAVGDVVGHGISAALLMTTVRALLRIRLDGPGPIDEAVADVNRLLCRDTEPSGSFVTLFLLQVEAATGRLEWVRAGHDPALLLSAANGEVQELNGPGMALGVDEAFSYPGVSPLGLHAGDIVLIGTDGIWDTRNSRSEKFGKARLADIMRRHCQEPAEAVLGAVLRSLEEFRGELPQEDDITLVVLKVAAPAMEMPG